MNEQEGNLCRRHEGGDFKVIHTCHDIEQIKHILQTPVSGTTPTFQKITEILKSNNDQNKRGTLFNL